VADNTSEMVAGDTDKFGLPDREECDSETQKFDLIGNLAKKMAKFAHKQKGVKVFHDRPQRDACKGACQWHKERHLGFRRWIRTSVLCGRHLQRALAVAALQE
jgi:hypothetical protein